MHGLPSSWLEGSRGPQAWWSWLTGLVTPRHVGSSLARDQTHVPCIARQPLNHWPLGKPQDANFLLLVLTVWLIHFLHLPVKPSFVFYFSEIYRRGFKSSVSWGNQKCCSTPREKKESGRGINNYFFEPQHGPPGGWGRVAGGAERESQYCMVPIDHLCSPRACVA